MWWVFTGPANGLKPAQSVACYLAPLRACFAREVEVSELLGVYLRRMIGHLFHKAPSAGTTTTKTIKHSWTPGWKRGGLAVQRRVKLRLSGSWKFPQKEQKRAPENSTGVFQTFERRPTSFSRHCEYITSWWVLPLLPELLDGFQMREVRREKRRGGVKGVLKKSVCLAPWRWSCAASITPQLYGARSSPCQNVSKQAAKTGPSNPSQLQPRLLPASPRPGAVKIKT